MTNHIIIFGRLTRDPEVKTTDMGTLANISVACERDYKSKDGEKQTDFFSVTVWRQAAEFTQKYFHKGDPIIVEGRMQSRKYTGKDGVEKTAWELNAERVSFAGGSRSGESNRSEGYEDRNHPSMPADKLEEFARKNPKTVKVKEEWTEGDADGELPF